MRRAVILGYYGFGNIGDEALLRAIISSLRHRFPDIELTALSYAPGETRAIHGIAAVHRYDLPGVVRTIKAADAFILGGGSLLQNATSTKSLLYYSGMTLLARLLGKPVMLYAQGIGPIKGPMARFLVRIVCRRAKAITVRDRESLELLRSLGINRQAAVVPDPAWALLSETLHPSPKPKQVRPLIGVSVRAPAEGFRAAGDDAFTQAIAQACDSLVGEVGAEILFIPFQEADIGIAKKVMGLMESRARLGRVYSSPRHMQNLIAHLDLLIGMRFHSVLFAALAGVPFVAISYDPKVDSLVRMLYDEPAGTIREISSGRLVKKVGEVWRKKEETRLQMENKRDELAHLALTTPELLSGGIRANVLGLPVDAVSMDGAAARVRELVLGNAAGYVVTLNAEMAMLAQRDDELRKIIRNAALVVADGAGVVWAASILGNPVPGRVAGYDLLHRICRDCAKDGLGIFLFGGAPGVAGAAGAKLIELYPGLRIAGTHHGYFGPDEEPALLDKIRSSGASILFVALGAPRQEKWIAANLEGLPSIRVAVGVGGSFDVLAGRTRRAPEWVGRLGFEWLYRLLREPRRFGRMLALPRFMAAVLLRRFGFGRETERKGDN